MKVAEESGQILPMVHLILYFEESNQLAPFSVPMLKT
jgi:hypothetical protein